MAPQIDMMVKVGAMTEEAGRNHPDRNTLTSAIAGVAIDKIDCPDKPTKVLPGDIVIVASDGLQYLTNDQIIAILREKRTSRSMDIAEALYAALRERDDPDQDNAAFTVIKLGNRQKSAATDAPSVLIQLKNDLGHKVKVIEAAPMQPAPGEGTPDPAADTQDPSGTSSKRIIRLVTSQARTFDRPDTAQENSRPVEQVRPQGHARWFRSQRSSND